MSWVVLHALPNSLFLPDNSDFIYEKWIFPLIKQLYNYSGNIIDTLILFIESLIDG